MNTFEIIFIISTVVGVIYSVIRNVIYRDYSGIIEPVSVGFAAALIGYLMHKYYNFLITPLW